MADDSQGFLENSVTPVLDKVKVYFVHNISDKRK